jgi:hypothetical protein
MADKEVAPKISLDLKALGENYNIPFQEIMKTIAEDRQLAKDNYEILKNKVVIDNDDSSAAKEQMNKAMELIIDSTDKLTSALSSASKLWGDTVKAMAIGQQSKPMSPQEIAAQNERRRMELMEEKDEKPTKKD